MNTSLTVLGGMLGSLIMVHQMQRLSKFNLLISNNIVLILASLISLIGNIYAIAIGRFFQGVCLGIFSVVCPKYINEFCPVELKGPFGGLNQFMFVLGGIIPSSLALCYPRAITESMRREYIVQQYWRVIWSFPIFIALAQISILLLCYKHETPIYLKQQGREDELMKVLQFFYQPDTIKSRYKDISASINLDKGGYEAEKVTIRESFKDPNLRRAGYIGVSLMLGQQFSGVNAVTSYSGQFFHGKTADEGLSQAMASEVINLARLLGVCIGLVMLTRLGRKTILLTSQVVVLVGLMLAWLFDVTGSDLTIMGIVIVMIGFQFGMGAIPWIYIAETCNDRAASVCSVVNWTSNLVIVVVAPYLYQATNGWMWLIFGVIVVIAIYIN